MRGSHCIELRDGALSLAGPGWSCDKLHAIWKFLSRWMPFLKSCAFQHIEQYLEGQSTCERGKDRQNYSAHQQCPKFSKWVSIFHLSLPVKNHVFSMTYLLWHVPHYSLVETQCHLETTDLWIQPLGRSKILQHLQHKIAKHCLKIWKIFLMLGDNTSPSQNLLFTTKFREK